MKVGKQVVPPGTVLVSCEVVCSDGRCAARTLLVAEELWDREPHTREIVTRSIHDELSDFAGFRVTAPVRVFRQSRRGDEIDWIES